MDTLCRAASPIPDPGSPSTPSASLTYLFPSNLFRVDDKWLSSCNGGKSCKKDLASWTLTAAKYV